MKEFSATTGGRLLTIDDIEHIQAYIKAIESSLNGYGNFVVYGCNISYSGGRLSIQDGYVFLDGRIRSVSAQNVTCGLNSTVYIVPSNTIENAVYRDGSTKPVRTNYGVNITTTRPAGTNFISISVTNGIVQQLEVMDDHKWSKWVRDIISGFECPEIDTLGRTDIYKDFISGKATNCIYVDSVYVESKLASNDEVFYDDQLNTVVLQHYNSATGQYEFYRYWKSGNPYADNECHPFVGSIYYVDGFVKFFDGVEFNDITHDQSIPFHHIQSQIAALKNYMDGYHGAIESMIIDLYRNNQQLGTAYSLFPEGTGGGDRDLFERFVGGERSITTILGCKPVLVQQSVTDATIKQNYTLVYCRSINRFAFYQIQRNPGDPLATLRIGVSFTNTSELATITGLPKRDVIYVGPDNGPRIVSEDGGNLSNSSCIGSAIAMMSIVTSDLKLRLASLEYLNTPKTVRISHVRSVENEDDSDYNVVFTRYSKVVTVTGTFQPNSQNLNFGVPFPVFMYNEEVDTDMLPSSDVSVEAVPADLDNQKTFIAEDSDAENARFRIHPYIKVRANGRIELVVVDDLCHFDTTVPVIANLIEGNPRGPRMMFTVTYQVN